MPYIHFTEEQKLRANSVDLVEFLRRQGEKLIPAGRDKRLVSDHSITVRGNEWYDHEAQQGGKAVSFVQSYYGLAYPDAVKRLLDCAGIACPLAQQPKSENAKPFTLPPANQTMRRVYAYLLQHRHISRDILNVFVKRGLIYESREPSKDQKKQYYNAVFVGLDEHGVARHAHKRGLYTQGQSYRGTMEGSLPQYSFHWLGNSDRLYVFEAPIDLLAFLTLYPEDWQRHSYVALCGTSEHSMLWILEQNQNLRKIILCLDHDAAGIESTGRLTEILREHGYMQVTSLRPKHKDWDEDLKFLHGLEAQPAEEHPQIIAAESVCQRIGAKCKEIQPGLAAQQVPDLLQKYRGHLFCGRFEEAMDCMETMSALALAVVLRECRQIGAARTPEQGAEFLRGRIQPHQNRSNFRNRTEEIARMLQNALAQGMIKSVHAESEKKSLASAWLNFAIACAKVPVKYAADEMKRLRKEAQAPRKNNLSLEQG